MIHKNFVKLSMFTVRQLGKILVKTLNLTYESTHYLLPNFPNSFFFSTATAKEIYSLIGNIKIKNAIRENDITNKLLKLSNAVISRFLCNIFNYYIYQGGFPNFLKIAEVVPVFEKRNSNFITNYRPISILCRLYKIFKKVLFNRINNYLEKYRLIPDKHFGL